MAGRIDPPSAYIKNCIPKIERTVYGIDNRQPIHDVIEYVVNGAAGLNDWMNELGLTVQNGKLCVVYDPAGTPDQPYVIPDSVKNALAAILTHQYVSSVRQDIVNSFRWGVENVGNAISQWQNLGLSVENGLLCVSYDSDASPDTPFVIPEEIIAAMEGILTDTYGPDIRNDIVTALQWGIENDFTQTLQEITDTGLIVDDGKLCIEF